MLFEYAVEPQAIGSSWQNFRYLIEKFGFDRGRLISQFPKTWFREVYEAAADMKPTERARVEIALNRAKQSKVIRSGRTYDPLLGDWLANAIAQHATTPFHAIISENNPAAAADVILVDDADEAHPLMISAHMWDVQRSGTHLAQAMGPLLRSARAVLWVDRYFDIRNPRYTETLKACLDQISVAGGNRVRCEIHFCDHDSRPPVALIEQNARVWLRGVIPNGMSIALFAWNQKLGGEDFHARYLLTDLGGLSVDAGFSAEGAAQTTQVALLDLALSQTKLGAFSRQSGVYDLVEPVLEILSDGSVQSV